MFKKTTLVAVALMIGVACAVVWLRWGTGPKGAKPSRTLGVIMPLTGDLANFGKTVLNGVDLAVENHNGRPGSIKLDIKAEDSQGKPPTAISALNKLLDVDHSVLIIGGLTSGETLALIPTISRRNVLLISPSASTPALSGASPLFFRVWPSDSFDGQVAAEFSFAEIDCRRAAVLYLNDDYSTGLNNVFTKSFRGLGGQVVKTESYLDGQTDFRTAILSILAQKPDLIYVPGHPRGIASILRQARELGAKATFFSNVAAEDAEFPRIAGNAAAGLYFTAPAFNSNDPATNVQSFVREYRSKYSSEPDVHAAKGYDAALVIGSALETGTFEPAQIAAYIRKHRRFEGVSGQLEFDENGDVATPTTIKRYKDDGNVETIRVFRSPRKH